MPIYTKTGDGGTTGFFGGKRVPKSHPTIDLYGQLDELNSWIGFSLSHPVTDDERIFLERIQSDLHTISSRLAGWSGSILGISRQVRGMERRIDAMQRTLPELSSFILPGGSGLGAILHITRTICRRLERRYVAWNADAHHRDHPLPSTERRKIGEYLNRLSDYLFVLARAANHRANVPEKRWTPNVVS